jgi:coenzyme PQQ synthesis protein D (PqqD)
MDQLTQESTLRPSESVREADNQDGAVLLDVRQGLCFSMNPVAALIWKQLVQGCNSTDVAHNLARTFDISLEQASIDVQEFVHQLAQLQLLRQPTDVQPRLTGVGQLRAFLGRIWNPRQQNGTRAK